MKYLIPLSILITVSSSLFADVIPPEKTKDYVGKTATVCGKAVQIESKANYTFINLNKPHSYQDFYFFYPSSTIPKSSFLNKKVCATGTIRIHYGQYRKYQIIVNSLDQFQIKGN